MKQGLSRSHETRHFNEKVLEKARAKFHRSGESVVSWAQQYGYTPALVYDILNGKRRCLRGQSHEIAVRLGIKDGIILEEAVES